MRGKTLISNKEKIQDKRGKNEENGRKRVID